MDDNLTIAVAIAVDERYMLRENLEILLASLSVPALKEVALMVGVRLGSGMRKHEMVDTILQFAVDLPHGDDVIKNFRHREGV